MKVEQDMSPGPILDQLLILAQDVSGVSPLQATVSEETKLTELGVSSLQLLSYITKLEAHFQIRFEDEEFEARHFKTLGQIVSAVTRKLSFDGGAR